ncbi:MAG: helix-turn-helix domain-containing protein [Vulcanimicrobiaceae bacterium]
MRKTRPKTSKKTAPKAPKTSPKPDKKAQKLSPTAKALLTYGEAAEVATVSRPTIVRAVRAGHLRVFRSPLGGIVRVHANSLAAWIERNSVGGGR